MLFLSTTIDKAILAGLEHTSVSMKQRLDSKEMIQLMKSHAENSYETLLDSCSVIVKELDHTEAIRCAVNITSEVSFDIVISHKFRIFCCILIY